MEDTTANCGEGFGNHELSSFDQSSSSEQDPGFLAISTDNRVLSISSQGHRVELGTFDREHFAAAMSEDFVIETLTLLDLYICLVARGLNNWLRHYYAFDICAMTVCV